MTDAWGVLTLFLIPVGGGIPGGVTLAQSRGIRWPEMMALYFISDVILAFVFEALVILFREGAKHFRVLNRFVTSMKASTQKTILRYGLTPGPFTLVMIAFGVDPMTGRTAALTAGHGFLSGWLLAITGDMIFFTVLMVSTLWLNGILGDGTLTAVIIMAAMIVVPYVIRKLRGSMADSR